MKLYPKVYGCSPIKNLHELGSIRRKTVWIISSVSLIKFVLIFSTKGLRLLYHWFIYYYFIILYILYIYLIII